MANKIFHILIIFLLIFILSSNMIYADNNFQSIYKSLSLKIMKSNVNNKTQFQNDLFNLINDNKDLLEKEEIMQIVKNSETNKIKTILENLIKQRKKELGMSIEEIKNYNNKKQTVFKGFFKNPNYDDPKVFLGHSSQSTITDITYSFVENINEKKDFSTLAEIFHKLNKFNEFKDNLNEMEIYANFTTEDYIKEQKLSGCTTYSLVFANMARAKGIPTVIVEGLKTDFINTVQNGNYNNHISGHFFTEVYIDNQWYLVDNTKGRLYLDYNVNNKILPNDNYLLGKGIDRWEFGMKMKEYFDENSGFFELVNSINLKGNKNPSYEYIDLRNMNLINSDYKDKIAGINLKNKVIYYFDAGKGDAKFRNTLQTNIKETDHGFIYHYLENYKQYKNEADILILSSNIPYLKLPYEIQEKITKNNYSNLSQTYTKIDLDNIDILIIKTN